MIVKKSVWQVGLRSSGARLADGSEPMLLIWVDCGAEQVRHIETLPAGLAVGEVEWERWRCSMWRRESRHVRGERAQAQSPPLQSAQASNRPESLIFSQLMSEIRGQNSSRPKRAGPGADQGQLKVRLPRGHGDQFVQPPGFRYAV